MDPPVCQKDRAESRSTPPGESQPMRDLSVDPDAPPSIMSQRKVLPQCFFLLLKSLIGRLCGLRHVPPHVYSWYGSWSQDLCVFSAQNIGMLKPWKCVKERESQTDVASVSAGDSPRDTKAKTLNCQSLRRDILKVLKFCLKMHLQKQRKRQAVTF